MPAVSVIMNCLNGERYVREAIQSIYDQTFQDWEIIFWDNASTDGTADIARAFDQRLRYFRSEATIPLGAARRRAMAEARGDWIAFQDHDDISLPRRFERQMAALAGGDYAFCYGGMREIDGEGAVIRDVLPSYGSGDQFARQLTQFEANLQTTIVSAAYLRRYDIALDESFIMFEDYNLFMKLAAKGPVCVVPEILCLCRILPTSWTQKSIARHAGERFRTLEQLEADNPGIAARHPDAFRKARARGVYYQARHEMQEGRHADARRSMARIQSVAPVYGALYLLSFWPALWKAAHGRSLKLRLTALLMAGKGN
jgi:glycosyltransferase involved in cell wall biosynthesis